MNKNNFKAVLFDLDGTLLDTSDFILGAFNYALEKHGFGDVTKQEVNEIMGTALPECYKLFAPGGDINALCDSHHEFQLNNLHLSKPFPDTVQALNYLKKQNIKIAAVTNRSNTVTQTLENSDLLPFFDVIITAEDVENPKPHPEPILKALNKLNIGFDEAIFVGDTEVDILAGKNAGVKTVGVTYGHIGKDIKKYSPDFLLDNLNEIFKII